MTMNEREEQDIDRLLDEIRDLRPSPSGDLMARILADAESVAAGRETKVLAPRRPGWLLALGGWPVVGGLVASTLVGLWIGAAQPDGLSDMVPVLGGEQVSVGFGLDLDPLSLLEG